MVLRRKRVQKVVERFDCSLQLLTVHRQRSIEQENDIAALLVCAICTGALIEDRAGLEVAVGVLCSEGRIAQVVRRDLFGSAIGSERQCAFRNIDAVVE